MTTGFIYPNNLHELVVMWEHEWDDTIMENAWRRILDAYRRHI
jgi:hypothetical protein